MFIAAMCTCRNCVRLYCPRRATGPGSSGHQLTETLSRVYNPTVCRLPSAGALGARSSNVYRVPKAADKPALHVARGIAALVRIGPTQPKRRARDLRASVDHTCRRTGARRSAPHVPVPVRESKKLIASLIPVPASQRSVPPAFPVTGREEPRAVFAPTTLPVSRCRVE